jgi:membrane dipeptidase
VENAERIHKEAIIIDGHCDTILTVAGCSFMGQKPRDFFSRGETGMIDLPRLKEGGVTCQVMAAYIEPQYKPTRSARRALELLDALYALVDQSDEQLRIATKAADIEAAKAAGDVSFLLSIEGGEAVEGSLALLRGFHKLGVRAMGLTWNQRNDIADGVGETSAGSGLTDFGVSLVKEMERLGMMVDVSHLSDTSFWSVDKVAERPYIASHSNARALASHRRNLTDKQIEALAKKGGVIGVVFASYFVDDNLDNVSIARLCDHIDHIKGIGGIDCVGLGSDFDGFNPAPGKPMVMKDASEMPTLTVELLSRGYTEEEVKKVLGGNWLRVYKEVIG